MYASFRIDHHAIYSLSITYKLPCVDVSHPFSSPPQLGYGVLRISLNHCKRRKSHIPDEKIRQETRQSQQTPPPQAQERLRQQQAAAQRSIEAIHQALEDLGFPESLVAEIEGRLQAQQQLLGKIVGLMFPTLFGARHPHELTRVRGWDKNVPRKLLSALPKRSWLKRLRRLGLEILLSIWRHTQEQRASTQSRWQWRWIVDDAVFRKYGHHFQLVGRWYSGQFKRPVFGSDGVLLLVVIGNGKLIIPVDFAIRRPNPKGPGRTCQDKLHLTQKMLDERLAVLAGRGVTLPKPMGVADSWCSDSKLMRHVSAAPQGTLLVQGKRS
jgi:hypothetical protein